MYEISRVTYIVEILEYLFTEREGLQRENLDLKLQLDILKDKVADWESSFKFVLDDKCIDEQLHCSCVPILQSRIKELEKKFTSTEIK